MMKMRGDGMERMDRKNGDESYNEITVIGWEWNTDYVGENILYLNIEDTMEVGEEKVVF